MADTADLLGDRLKVAAVDTARLQVAERLPKVADTARLLAAERLPKVVVADMARLQVAERLPKVAAADTELRHRAERLADMARPPHRAVTARHSSKVIPLRARWFLLEPAAR